MSKKINDPVLLKTILEETADYCERLKQDSYRYYCRENILQKMHFLAVEKTSYICSYQFVKKGDHIRETRRVLEAFQNKNEKKDKTLKLRLMYQNPLFAAYGMLSKSWQSDFKYQIIEKTKYKGVNVIILEAKPKDKNTVDHPWGRVWIDLSDFSVVKVVFNMYSLKDCLFGSNVRQLGIHLKRKFGIHQIFNFEIDFLKEFEGIRYPTQVNITEKYGSEFTDKIRRGSTLGGGTGKYRWSGDRITFLSETRYKTHKNRVPNRPLSEIITIYDDYKFLRVNIKDVIYNKK